MDLYGKSPFRIYPTIRYREFHIRIPVRVILRLKEVLFKVQYLDGSWFDSHLRIDQLDIVSSADFQGCPRLRTHAYVVKIAR